MLCSRNLAMLSAAAILVLGTSHAASATEPDSVELSNLAACYADGIDLIGNGKSDAGAARWRQCFAEDLKLTLTFGTTFTNRPAVSLSPDAPASANVTSCALPTSTV